MYGDSLRRAGGDSDPEVEYINEYVLICEQIRSKEVHIYDIKSGGLF